MSEQIKIIPKDKTYQIDLHIAGYHFGLETNDYEFAQQARDDIKKKLDIITRSGEGKA